MSRVDFNVVGADGNEYLLLPACAYNGNRFKSVVRKYPPMFLDGEASADMEITITDVPKLNKDGSSRIEVTTGDVATPCVAVFLRSQKKAVFVYTVQEIDGKNIGLAYEKGVITLSYPAYRQEYYYQNRMNKNEQPYIDIEKDIPHKVFEIDCECIEDFYRFYFDNRKVMGMDDAHPEVLPPQKQFEIQRDKFNNMNWTGKFYDIDGYGQWQPGWVGGAMSGYALMKCGGEVEKERAIKTLEHLFENQSPITGLFYGHDKEHNDGFNMSGRENWVLIRKSADAFYFLFKHYRLMEKVPQAFIDKTRLLADYFVKLWQKNGQLGQFLDCVTGEIVAGNSTSGAIVPAGLVEAFRFFKDKKYLDVAIEASEYMYNKDALSGYTTGGPGEILQGVDSESAFALLESTVLLYEETKDKTWLDRSEYLLWYCSSWVVSYNYKFPNGSEFARHDMKTIGSVFANIQNKHSAPGICTLSGDSIKKLYGWTGNEKYKELCDDISLTIAQYMSYDKRVIYSWDNPPKPTPSGFINERVNMSDWESPQKVGGVFFGSCWSETSNLLTLAELIDF